MNLPIPPFLADALHTGFALAPLDIAVIVLPLILAFGVTRYMRRYSRSVADYLAAGRSAGRYLISTAQMEMGVTAAGVVAAMEVFSETGFSLNLWNGFVGFFYFLLAMSGLITYRFRETRALTFHQFFEIRYSKRLRVVVTVVNVISSLFTIGVGPAVAARFFVYYLGFPPAMNVLGLTLPTFAVILAVIMAIALYFAFAGGHLTIMTTDCLEGIISSFLYLVVAFAILWLFSYQQMGAALATGAPGASYLDPFDIDKRPNFNYTYILLGWGMTVYFWRGNAWNAAFAASAKSAHEGQMSVVLGTWRGMASAAMGGLIGLGAFTLMHNPEFAGHADAVRQHLQTTIPDGDIQLRTQLLLPTALGMLLPVGVKGALCAVLCMGLIAGCAATLHGFAGSLVQDVVLPFRGRPLEPKQHVRALRWTAIAIGIYAIIFGAAFHIPDYVVMVTQLMSAVYLAGVGAVVWGGLYWKRGTVQGAWAAVMTGAVLSLLALGIQQFWQSLVPLATQLLGPGIATDYLLANPLKCPINGQILSAIIMGTCLLLYVGVSLLTCREDYDLDRLLHRGKYAIDGEQKVAISKGFRFSKIVGINENYTRGDRRIAYFTFFWGLLPNLCGIVLVVWNLGFARWSNTAWWRWHYFWSVAIPIVGGVITTIWFAWGAWRDLRTLFHDLREEKIDINDDGQVHQTEVAEEDKSEPTLSK